jgi:glycosyltransferase involved in cell wall biosynthesis
MIQISSDGQIKNYIYGKMACDVTVIILTYNESIHLERAIASVRKFANDIIVVDSFSDDNTVEMAFSSGARVFENKFINQAKQFQWALDNGNISTKWILRLDADEIIEQDLADNIIEKLPSISEEIVGINFQRKHIFMNKWVRYGGRYPLTLLRLWRLGHGRVEDRWMDEHVVVWGGRTVTFEGGFLDHNLNNLTFFTEKHNKYATREAIDVISKKYNLINDNDNVPQNASIPRQAKIKRLFKEKIYNKLPMWAGPLGYLLYRVFILRGLLDGKSGMIYHVLQGFWYRYLVNAKIFEYEVGMSDCCTKEERIERLSILTGQKIL